MDNDFAGYLAGLSSSARLHLISTTLDTIETTTTFSQHITQATMSNPRNHHEGEADPTSRRSADDFFWSIIFHHYRTLQESNLLCQIESISEKIDQLQDRLQRETPKLGIVAEELRRQLEGTAGAIESSVVCLRFWVERISSSIRLFSEHGKEIRRGAAQAEKHMGAVLDLYGDHREEIDQYTIKAVNSMGHLEKNVSESSRAIQSFQRSQHPASDALDQQLKECTPDLNEMGTSLQNLRRAISRKNPSTIRLSRQVADLAQEKSKQLEGQKKSYLDQLAKKSSETQDLQEKLDASEKNNDNLSQKLRDTAKKLSEQIEQRQKSQKERQVLNQHLVPEQRKNQELNTSHEAAKERLSSEHTREVQELREQLDHRDAEIEALVKSHSATIEQLRSEHQEEIRTTHETALQSLKAEYQKEIDHFNRRMKSKDSFARELVSTHAENIKKLQAKQKDKTDELKRAIQALKESNAEQVEEAKLAKQEHRSSLMSLQNQYNAVSLQLTQSEEGNEHMQEGLVELQAMNAALQQDHQDLVGDLREVRQLTTARNVRQREIVLLLGAVIEIAMTTAAERGAAALHQEAAAASLRFQLAEHEINVAHLHAKTGTLAKSLEFALHRNEEMSERSSVLLSALVVVAVLLAVSWWC